MEIAKYIVLGLYVIVCVALIILATMQNKEKSGASGTITGSSTNNFYEQNKGRTKEGKLKKWTIILGIVFVILAVALGILYLV
ncbi:MAG: preprotein translocase subunit SecG [Clostridia bacterium]|jgi:preprotein translocase subunit SecG|nr:preprotein translocase subunit SecG [Clostridia bacterium]